MGLLDRFRKKETTPVVEAKLGPTPLEKLCHQVEGLSTEEQSALYGDLSNLLFLEPTKIAMTYKKAIEDAVNLERSGDLARARTQRRIPIGLAFYNGNKKGVIKNLKAYVKSMPVKPNEEPYKTTLKYTDKAMWVAKQLYSKPEVKPAEPS
jgi:hypothetical protein